VSPSGGTKGVNMAKEELNDAAKTLLALRDDPVLFVRTCLQAEPQKWQREALQNIAKNNRLSVRSGHAVGKTTFLSWTILWWLTTHYPCKIAATANSASQLEQILWSEIQKWHKMMPVGFQEELEFRSDKITLKNAPDSFCVSRTSRRENPEALQGFHSPNMLFIIDEASGVPDIIFEVAQGAMSTPGAKTIMVGNPNRSTGYFYDSFNKNLQSWETMTVSCLDADTVDPQYVEDMKRQYGEDSNVYRVRVLGLPPETDDNAIMGRVLVESAIDREVDPIEVFPVWGIDVARHGSDRCALCKRKGNVITEPIKHWGGKDLMETVGIIMAEYESTPFRERPSEVLVDSIGLGAGVVDRLVELNIPARGINVAESSSLSNRYMRLRDELWFKCREWLEHKDCQIPDQDELITELTAVQYSIMSNGKFKVESKDEMKKRGMRSPDIADSLMLTFASNAIRASGNNAGYKFNQSIDYGDSGWIV
tara:strand:- start:985 stop:2424 length:1440 start_codon:yes stop_codon:yes gene_type:complete